MRRWNGWGDEQVDYPLPASAGEYLATLLGDTSPEPDATLEEVLASVPPSRLRTHAQIDTTPLTRLRHARGQSLPDWIALRAGLIDAFPDGVASPSDEAEVRALLAYAAETGARVIPYGGGTSVVGHINPRPGEAPKLTLALGALQRPLALDAHSRLATFEAGATGPAIESYLAQHGFTLGHFPQSWEYSTLGGWIATRSSGQQSYRYGRIEDLFAGGHVESPIGPFDFPPHPASAAGPDLRHLMLGSEGRLGVITSATVRVRPKPERESFHAAFFRTFEAGAEAMRTMVQSDVRVSMLRLSDALETRTTLALSGREHLVMLAERGLTMLRYGPDRALLLYGLTGGRSEVRQAHRQVKSILRTTGGLYVGTLIGEQWRHSRFRTPYLRNTLWTRGYATDTLETALTWSGVLALADALKTTLRTSLGEAEPVLAFSHLSHVYHDGASIYVTFLFRRAADPHETLEKWVKLKDNASRTILEHGGTISHQHGVGSDHAPYLPQEKGEAGMASLLAVQQALDPAGIFNPGNLLGDG